MLSGVTPGTRLLREEIFGPVAPIAPFSSDDEALAAANDSEYGLVAYVFTKDVKRALRVVEGLQSGMVGLNKGLVSNPAAPFGGVKQSGFGREGGVEGIEEYLATKYVGDQSGLSAEDASVLGEYRRKRRFAQTPEPSGDGVAPTEPGRAVRRRTSTTRGGCTGTCGWSATGCWRRGRSRTGSRTIRAATARRSTSRTIRSSTSTSTARSRPASTAPARSRCGTSGTYVVREVAAAQKVIVVFDGERLKGRYALFQAGRTEKDWMIHRMDPPAKTRPPVRRRSSSSRCSRASRKRCPPTSRAGRSR